MKIKAAVLNAIGAKAPYAESKPLTVEEVELAPPGHGEVLVKIGAAGLCHSDCRSSTATARVPCRWRWVTRRQASSNGSAKGSPICNGAIMSCWCSCRAVDTAARVRKGALPCANRGPLQTALERCCPGSDASAAGRAA